MNSWPFALGLWQRKIAHFIAARKRKKEEKQRKRKKGWMGKVENRRGIERGEGKEETERRKEEVLIEENDASTKAHFQRLTASN